MIGLMAMAVNVATNFKRYDGEIVFASSAALSGPQKEIGKAYTSGIKTYFRYINENGGISGKKIKYIVYDDKYEPSIAKQNIIKIIKTHKNLFGILSIAGTYSSKETLKVLKNKITLRQIVPSILEKNKTTDAYIALYKKYYPGYKPNAAALEGFLASKVIVEALKQSQGEDKESFIEALSNLKLNIFGNTISNYSDESDIKTEEIYLVDINSTL